MRAAPGALPAQARSRVPGGTAAIALLLSCASTASANGDPLTDMLPASGGAGLGVALRFERSPYAGGGTRNDLLPLYLYEGRHIYLHASRAGLKRDDGAGGRVDLFLAHRFEGFPYDRVPPALAGMNQRGAGLDLGASYERSGPWGAAYAELLHDVSAASRGNEFRLGYRYDWDLGRLRLRPHAALALRDARLNDYYYGVAPAEALPERPAHSPGAGVNVELGLFGAYRLSERLRLLGGVSLTRWPRGVRESPIVDARTQGAGVIGLMYAFAPEARPWPEPTRLSAKLLYGASSECDVAKIVRLACTSTHTEDRSGIAGFEIGRPFIEALYGRPLDLYGYLGVLRHREKGLQPDFWQVSAYMKAYYHGFPWSDRVRTRAGLGAGLSYAHGIPIDEARERDRRNTSRLLNYLSPTIDVSIGDLIGARSLRDAYLGLGVSHRSGIFASSQLLGNVKGGSNYIYSYVEWKM